MSLLEDARQVLGAWSSADPDQRRLRAEYLAHLDKHPAGMWRDCQAGHLTASTIVFDASCRHVLLTLHPKHERWLQLGGHCEQGDASLVEAAFREAVEEGGIADLKIGPEPVRLDRHPSKCYPPPGSWHLDVQYVGTVPDGSVATISEESTDLRWWPTEALPGGADAIVHQLVEAGLASLARGAS